MLDLSLPGGRPPARREREDMPLLIKTRTRAGSHLGRNASAKGVTRRNVARMLQSQKLVMDAGNPSVSDDNGFLREWVKDALLDKNLRGGHLSRLR
jgi:hypothetical protein